MPRLSKIGAAALAAFGWTSGVSAVSASYLVVAGGGGGGDSGDIGGGGGAGGYLTGTASLNPTLSYTVTVGAGGAPDVNGSNSVFNSVTSIGGGKGGTNAGASPSATGGSGGGGGATNGTGSAGTSGQGFAGGNGDSVNGGGGGGASEAGNTDGQGYGGDGTASSITGSSVTYAGGGGGSAFSAADGYPGGDGGGGKGGGTSVAPTGGTANTGGGGGGVRSGAGMSGGSGIVIISYAGAQQFGGGVVTSVGGNTIHTFTTSGTLVPVTPLSASYLVVAGGGGGGYQFGGGGGAGGLLSGSSLTIDSASTYLVTVGAGGAGATATSANGVSGSNSTFSMVSTAAVGGGGGGSRNGAGSSGGSGGGGAGDNSSVGGSATSGQGFAGGTGSNSSGDAGGGGGGSGAAGSNAATTVAGAGGVGTASSISGTSTYYAGGGGGAGTTPAAGGNGGGGAGKNGSVGTAGTANTGGGGGASYNTYAAGAGGSGIVIISYAGATQLMAGGTVTISGGNVIHTFTSTGYLAPLKLVNNSLRFRKSASAYLNRTFGTPTSLTTWAWSGWVKRGELGTSQYLFHTRNAGNTVSWETFFQTDNTLIVRNYDGASYNANYVTTQLFRDPAAWYHVVITWDTTNTTSTDRVRIYINGSRVTAFTTSTAPASSANSNWNTATYVHAIGAANGSTSFDGYLTEINFIDGQALTPNSFGTFNSYGVWQPITYGGSYGTNGFYLPFTNKTSTTTLGYDFSPNGNNWTTNNISLTAGATYDSMTDVPTLTSATAANFAVANPLSTLFTVTSGNLDFTYTNSTSGVWYLKGTLAVSSDKYYWEVIPTNVGAGSNISVGIILSTNTQTNTTTVNLVTDGYVYHCDGNKYSGAGGTTGVAYGATYTNNDVIGVALDLTAGTLVFYKNNVSQGTAFTGLTSSYMLLVCNHLGGTSRTVAGSVNAGQRPFTYTPPTGFVALNTFNL
jgi:hypothetical protein